MSKCKKGHTPNKKTIAAFNERLLPNREYISLEEMTKRLAANSVSFRLWRYWLKIKPYVIWTGVIIVVNIFVKLMLGVI